MVALLWNCNNSALSIVTATLTLLGQGDLTYVTILTIIIKFMPSTFHKTHTYRDTEISA
jgi:hypothetical protein